MRSWLVHYPLERASQVLDQPIVDLLPISAPSGRLHLTVRAGDSNENPLVCESTTRPETAGVGRNHNPLKHHSIRERVDRPVLIRRAKPQPSLTIMYTVFSLSLAPVNCRDNLSAIEQLRIATVAVFSRKLTRSCNHSSIPPSNNGGKGVPSMGTEHGIC
jgi:hypothetical protein